MFIRYCVKTISEMNDNGKNCKILSWISWKTYNLGTIQKTLIFEQHTQRYYLLDNKASVCWNELQYNNSLTYDSAQVLQLLIDDGIILMNCSSIDLECNESHINKYINIPQDFCDEIKSNGYIFDAHWDITNKCNAKCIHCYNQHAHDGTRNIVNDELTFDESLKLVDELDYLGVFRLVLSGGEVLTKDYFIPLSKYIRERHIQLVIYTNGIALTDNMLANLVEIHPSTVCFSVYGDNDMVHDSITQVKGSYKRIISALSHLKEYSIETCHKNTLLLSNYHCWRDTLIKGGTLANHSLINCTIYPSMDDAKITKYSLGESQLCELALSPDSPIYYKRKIVGSCNIFKDKNITPCYNTTNMIYVNPNGDVYPCIAFPCVIASFRRGNIKDLKRNNKREKFECNFDKMNNIDRLDNWRSLKISDLKECGKHDYCRFCIDVCPGDAYLLTGDPLQAAENHCIIAKARYGAFLQYNDDICLMN